ncbi:ATP-binding protein [Nonomuraea sp. NPDC050540]|uniref:ATP-binding protein n=1 Tax=Nonomuraea sp. NPDC050540 TaxID=3364367 RepID=UPI0037B2A1E9
MMVIYSFPPTQQLQPVDVLHLACSDRAPYLAREAVSAWLGPGHPAREIAVLAASELITNAVRYADTSRTGGSSGNGEGDGEGGQGSITLKLCQGTDYLRLGVTDSGSSCSKPSAIPLQEPSLNAECGRGLAIVQALSHNRWGSFRLPVTGGRVVWCHLDLDPTPAQIEELFRAPV